MLPIRFLAAFVPLMLPAASLAAASPPAVDARPLSPAEGRLLQAEDERFAAQVRHDYAVVADGLADELIYSHGSGRRQSRDEYLTALKTGNLDYHSIATADRTAHVYGNVGVTRATLTMQVGDRTMRSSVLGVYVKRHGRWQLASWQTTPLEGPGTPTR